MGVFKRSISLALGGGGARGFAHIGVLKVLEREKIPIEFIVGTSMGAIVGAVYAQLLDSTAVEEKFKSLLKNPSFKTTGLDASGKKRLSDNWLDHLARNIKESVAMNVAAYRRSVFGMERLSSTLEFLLEDGLLQETRMPFAAVASDLIDGDEVILNKGSIIEAVTASAALPGYLPPVDTNGRLLIDGAATSPVPIRAAKKLVTKSKVLAIDVSKILPREPELDNIIDIVLQSYQITARHYHDELIKEADFLLQPSVGEFHWSQFDKLDWLIQEGEFAAENALTGIKKLVKGWF